MSTRAAAAATSRRVKQQLVNVLFKAQHSGKGRDAHRKLDFASYSYDDLRNEYLKRIKVIHPDRRILEVDNITNDVMSREKKTHTDFVELQEAWDAYEKVAKAMHKGQADSLKRGVQENFTRFGVGCSFSDSVEESNRRAEIMDQAGKGWCLAGQLSEFTSSSEIGSGDEKKKKDQVKNFTSLIDEDMFQIDDDNCDDNVDTKKKSSRRSLIPHHYVKWDRV